MSIWARLLGFTCVSRRKYNADMAFYHHVVDQLKCKIATLRQENDDHVFRCGALQALADSCSKDSERLREEMKELANDRDWPAQEGLLYRPEVTWGGDMDYETLRRYDCIEIWLQPVCMWRHFMVGRIKPEHFIPWLESMAEELKGLIVSEGLRFLRQEPALTQSKMIENVKVNKE